MSKNLIRTILLCCLVTNIGISQAEIYQWTDSQGNVHFSDEPHPNAKSIELPKAQTFSSPKIELPKTDDKTTNGKPQASYTIKILAPVDEATIRNNQNTINVSLDITPSLKKGDKVQIVLDGTPIGSPVKNTSFIINDVYRGTHTIVAKVVNKDGKVLNTSKAVTFFMKQSWKGMGKHGK